jgi:hypothetical protein
MTIWQELEEPEQLYPGLDGGGGGGGGRNTSAPVEVLIFGIVMVVVALALTESAVAATTKADVTKRLGNITPSDLPLTPCVNCTRGFHIPIGRMFT